MKFSQKLIPGTLIKRYKRFLADVQLDSGEIITAHTANSGSMKGLVQPGNSVLLSFHDKPSRRLKFSWEIVKVGRVWVGVNTHLPNLLVEEGVQNGVITELQGYAQCQREVRYGKNSRIDLLLRNNPQDLCYVEVKNVTLVEDQVAYFPDAVTERGRKHLEELASMVQQGHRAVIFYVVQRSDGRHVESADHIDARYGETLRWAVENGVEAMAYRAKVSRQQIFLNQRMKVQIFKP